jgi:hypothetical protein
MHAKNGPTAFHYELFFRLEGKTHTHTHTHTHTQTYTHTYTPLQRSGGTQFLDPAVCLSAQPFSINKVSFLPVTPVLQRLILESILTARTL